MNDPLPVVLGLGLVLGLRHAFEADHLVCVSTIVSEQHSVLRSALVGALWGLGHTAALLLAGIFIILLRFRIPPAAEGLLQLAVGLMTLLLGARLLYLSRGRADGRGLSAVKPDPEGRGGAIGPREGTPAVAVSGGAPRLTGWKPLAVGVVHGLAGSAALTLLVLTEVTRDGSAGAGLIYLIVFGAGSVGGMVATSTLIGLSFALAARRLELVNSRLRVVAGAGSVLFGLYYTWNTAAGF